MKYNLIKPKINVVDLGAAPGSWSEYVVQKQRGTGHLVSVDLLPVVPLDRMTFIQGDFTLEKTQEKILQNFNNSSIALVLSDIAPNITGIAARDQANIEFIQKKVLLFCQKALGIDGMVLTKVFNGEQLITIKESYEDYFQKIKIIKPPASRTASKEVFLLGQGFISEHKRNQISL